MADSSEESWITRYIEATVQDILNFISTGDVPRMQIKSVCARSLGVTCKELLLALMVAGPMKNLLSASSLHPTSVSRGRNCSLLPGGSIRTLVLSRIGRLLELPEMLAPYLGLHH